MYCFIIRLQSLPQRFCACLFVCVLCHRQDSVKSSGLPSWSSPVQLLHLCWDRFSTGVKARHKMLTGHRFPKVKKQTKSPCSPPEMNESRNRWRSPGKEGIPSSPNGSTPGCSFLGLSYTSQQSPCLSGANQSLLASCEVFPSSQKPGLDILPRG